MQAKEITEPVIGAAIEVHRAIGPGLLGICLCPMSLLRTQFAKVAFPFGTARTDLLQRATC